MQYRIRYELEVRVRRLPVIPLVRLSDRLITDRSNSLFDTSHIRLTYTLIIQSTLSLRRYIRTTNLYLRRRQEGGILILYMHVDPCSLQFSATYGLHHKFLTKY